MILYDVPCELISRVSSSAGRSIGTAGHEDGGILEVPVFYYFNVESLFVIGIDVWRL